ncbi:hypothetical protein EST38_g11547 [Candolleomyces aberdarensis]|uniref:Mid2 domain-containing protein n=1 Tax=Candolleomyces aberdarensis TaxID=2316362 RepID=A0A4Q2D4L7_9AGAR|nr:hypothetical protein EST38_g11547 [Candolleomyces aberdarensis]
MVRLTALVLALAPVLAWAQTTVPPPLETNTGAGATSRTGTTIRLNTVTGRTTTTGNITGFTATYPIVSRYPVRVTQSGVVYISTATITLTPTTRTPVVQAKEESGTNKGAIAGGVVGALAVLLAIIATLLWFRRRSPAYWKSKTGRGWRNMGDKPPLLPTNSSQANFSATDDKPKVPEFQRPPGRSLTNLRTEDPFKDPVAHEVEAPPPALYIREHRQPTHDPFADPLESPTSPARPTHKRGTSSVNPLLPSSN